MSAKAAVTVNRPPAEVEQLWASSPHRIQDALSVRFSPAPGDRGTEIHVEVDTPGRLGQVVGKVRGDEPLAKAKDALRRFKQLTETGVLPVSDGAPEGEALERKRKPHPAQPLDGSELQKVGG